MKNLFKKFIGYLPLLASLSLILSCKGIYENVEPYSDETIYPAKYDTIISKIGYERVEIDLMKAGRIPSKQISMGKSTKTIIEYDDKKIVIDSLVSWINVKNLDQPKLYRIKVYTLDAYNNKSVPQQIAVIPYTSSDKNNLVVSSPRVLTSPNAAVIDWTTSLSSILLDYKSLDYEYKDRNATVIKGKENANPRIFAANLVAGQAFEVKITYNVVPKVNGRAILDTVQVTLPLNVSMPTSSTPFNPVERDILVANGVTDFTAASVSSFKKLTFPVHTNTLQDLFYFPNIEELDLTGGNLFQLLTMGYDRNGVVKTIGGGDYLPFIRKVSPISNANAQTLVDLLSLGLIKKIKYVPNSMGIDHLLKPFDKDGVIEWVPVSNESIIPMSFFLDGKIQDNAWAIDLEVPTNSAPAGTNIVNPIRAKLAGRSASFSFVLPKEYRFNIPEYRYLKFKVYAPAASAFAGIYSPYQRLWPRIMNYMWAFGTESSFGQEYFGYDANNFKIADGDLQKWTEVTVDLADHINKHSRVIVINIGGEPSLTFSPPADIVYYFSNFRFSK